MNEIEDITQAPKYWLPDAAYTALKWIAWRRCRRCPGSTRRWRRSGGFRTLRRSQPRSPSPGLAWRFSSGRRRSPRVVPMTRLNSKTLAKALAAACAALLLAASLSASAYAYEQRESVVAYGHGYNDAGYLVVHETANPGASAANHVSYWSNKPDYAVHYVMELDGSVVYHTVPDWALAWHVGNGKLHRRNRARARDQRRRFRCAMARGRGVVRRLPVLARLGRRPDAQP